MMPVFLDDIADLGLAPVLLHLDERIEKLSSYSQLELRRHVALESDHGDHHRDSREHALLIALSRDIDLH